MQHSETGSDLLKAELHSVQDGPTPGLHPHQIKTKSPFETNKHKSLFLAFCFLIIILKLGYLFQVKI